jgi:UDP-N-acetylmuramoylalanine--D-glutamate ligase
MPLVDVPHVRDVVGLGTSGPKLVEEAGERGHLASSMEDAVETAARLARPGDTVLLAPGAASFDQFESYAHRGEVFAAAVTQLREEQR